MDEATLLAWNQRIAVASIKQLGGATKTARALTRMTGREVSADSVRQWHRKGVPAHLVLFVERLTGRPVETLRPDMSPRTYGCTEADQLAS